MSGRVGCIHNNVYTNIYEYIYDDGSFWCVQSMPKQRAAVKADGRIAAYLTAVSVLSFFAILSNTFEMEEMNKKSIGQIQTIFQ